MQPPAPSLRTGRFTTDVSPFFAVKTTFPAQVAESARKPLSFPEALTRYGLVRSRFGFSVSDSFGFTFVATSPPRETGPNEPGVSVSPIVVVFPYPSRPSVP